MGPPVAVELEFMTLQGAPVVILGVPGSGSGCLAECLVRLGLDFGNPEPPHRITELEELDQKGYSLFGISFFQANLLPDEWRKTPGADQFMAEVTSLLDSKFSGQSRWGINEPGATGLLPVYHELLTQAGVNPRYAVCVRHPLSVIQSKIAKQAQMGLLPAGVDVRNHQPPIGEHLMGLWLHYTLYALKETQGAERQVVSYEGFIDDPQATLDRISKRILAGEPSNAQLAEAVAAVRPDCCHHRHALEDLSEWPSIISRTYALCLETAKAPDALNSGKFDPEIDALWNEAGLMAKMIQPILLPAGEMLFSWRDGAKPGQFGVKYSPTGAWQTLRAEFTPPGGTAIQIDPYQTPCQIWIRKAVWRSDGEERPAAIQPGPSGSLEDLGLMRLSVFGPGPLITKSPGKGGLVEFEIEFLVQFSPVVLTNLVGMLRTSLEKARRGY